MHKHYSCRSSLAIKWENFHDPQSGIHHYVWCISTINSTCEVHPPTLAHLSTMQFVTDLNLNTSVPYIVQVMATNNVGLSCISCFCAFSSLMLVHLSACSLHSLIQLCLFVPTHSLIALLYHCHGHSLMMSLQCGHILFLCSLIMMAKFLCPRFWLEM